jgi:hypothetical protein
VVDAYLAHLQALGLSFDLVKLEAVLGPQLLLLFRMSDAIGAEHVRTHAERCRVELELPIRPRTPVSSADKLRALSRLLTGNPLPGQSHARLEAGAVSLKAGGLELVGGSLPLHDRALNACLHAELRRVFVLSDEQLTVVRDHYGEELGFYYALLNFACLWLSPIAALGLLFLLVQYSDAQPLYNAAYIPFASTSVVWGALLFVFWRRRARELALRWDVSTLHEVQAPNPRFRGAMVRDELHGAKPHVPYWSRLPAFAHTAVQMALQAVLLVLLEYCVYAHWVWLNETFDAPEPPFVYYLHAYVLNSLLYIVLIM